tara:strand:- start:44 stop:724 length:681 start_codon:yes stop_codon:yes gene_type:complete
VSETLAPSAGTPSSIADGATLDAGLLRGWKVKDANGSLKTMSDDGTTLDIVLDAVSGDSESTTGNFWLTNPHLFFDTPLMGDFTYSLRFDSDASMGSALSHLALMVGDGSASGKCHGVCARFGRWQTTNGRNTTYYLVDTGGTSESNSDAVAWTTAREIQIKRTAGTITVSTRVGATDSWVAYSTQKLDVAGGHCYAAIVFYAATNGEKFRLYAGSLTGFEYTANP